MATISEIQRSQGGGGFAGANALLRVVVLAGSDNLTVSAPQC